MFIFLYKTQNWYSRYNCRLLFMISLKHELDLLSFHFGFGSGCDLMNFFRGFELDCRLFTGGIPYRAMQSNRVRANNVCAGFYTSPFFLGLCYCVELFQAYWFNMTVGRCSCLCAMMTSKISQHLHNTKFKLGTKIVNAETQKFAVGYIQLSNICSTKLSINFEYY